MRNAIPEHVTSPAAQSAALAIELTTDAVWRVPVAGGETSVPIFIRLTNTSAEPVRFHLFDTFRLALTTASGTPVPIDGGRNATRAAPVVSDMVPHNGHYTVSRPASLVHHGNELRLIGQEPFGGIWHFDGLRPGVYRIQAICENDKAKVGERGPLWTGSIATPPLEIRIE